jgi:hypothetical protein
MGIFFFFFCKPFMVLCNLHFSEYTLGYVDPVLCLINKDTEAQKEKKMCTESLSVLGSCWITAFLGQCHMG